MYLWEEKLLSILGSACIQLWALINGLFKAAIGMPLRQGIGMDISHWTFIIIDCFILCADLVRILKKKANILMNICYSTNLKDLS